MSPTYRSLCSSIAMLMLAVPLIGCQDDEAPWKPYSEELCELHTDHEGNATSITTDSGNTLKINSISQKFTPDSIYRAIAIINHNDDAPEAHLLQFVSAPKSLPNIAANAGKDAVRLLSCWRTERYVNLRIAIPCSEIQRHAIGFADDGIIRTIVTAGKPNRKTRRIRLLHYVDDDRQDFYQESIISCPVYDFEGELEPGLDSIQMTVYTEKGPRVFTTPF